MSVLIIISHIAPRESACDLSVLQQNPQPSSHQYYPLTFSQCQPKNQNRFSTMVRAESEHGRVKRVREPTDKHTDKHAKLPLTQK